MSGTEDLHSRMSGDLPDLLTDGRHHARAVLDMAQHGYDSLLALRDSLQADAAMFAHNEGKDSRNCRELVAQYLTCVDQLVLLDDFLAKFGHATYGDDTNEHIAANLKG